MRLLLTTLAVWLVAQPAAPRSVWVLQAPDRIVEFDAATFTARRTVTVPRRAFDHPEHLAINAHGQILLVGAGDRVWFWNGRTSAEWAKDAGPDAPRQWFLSAAGDVLFAAETRLLIQRDAGGLEQSVRGATRVVQTDLSGGNARTAFTLPDLPACTCETGACSETCPVWTAWAPGGGVGNFLLMTRFVEGQLQSDYQRSVMYHHDGRAWTPRDLPSPVEAPLDASPGGDVLLEAKFDSACCGWVNERSDRLILLRTGKRRVVYDEWERFDNPNYDASFFASGLLDPSGASLAYTIAADAPRADAELRVSADGQENREERARVRKTAAELPMVEVVDVNEPGTRRASIPGAALVGWLDAGRILVGQNGRLAVFDRAGANRRDLPIQVRSAADAFVR